MHHNNYKQAQNVWKTLTSKPIRDYQDLDVKSDVLVLADVFENFRKTYLNHYKLDPAHYHTSPGLTWDACLKDTGQKVHVTSSPLRYVNDV